MDNIEHTVAVVETPAATTSADNQTNNQPARPKRRWLKVTGWMIVVFTVLIAIFAGYCVNEGLVVIDGEPSSGVAGFGVGMAALACGILFVLLGLIFAVICVVSTGVIVALIMAGVAIAMVLAVLAALSPILVPLAIAGYVIYRIVRKPPITAA